MPWVTLIMAILSYLMSPRNTPAERRRAVLNGVVAGGVTYGVTHYTDWGRENLGQFDGAITPTPEVNATDGSPSQVAGAAKPVSQGGSNWSGITKWASDALVAVGAVGLASTASKWVPWALAAFAGYWFFVRDSNSKTVVVTGDRS